MTKQFWKQPPREKIFEALGAIADGRVSLTGSNSAAVVSSSGTKTYEVVWKEGETAFSSNDNASFWQGYLGYPILAVLMRLGRITFDPDIADLLKGVPWKSVNQQFRNDYRKAVGSVLERLRAHGIDTSKIEREVDRIFEQVSGLQVEKLSKRARPPAEGQTAEQSTFF